MTTAQLGEIASIVRGIAFPKEDKRAEPLPGHVACLRTTNVQRVVEWDDLWFVPEKHVKRDEQLVRSGDILISTANSYELVGKVAPVLGIPHKATLGAFISLIRPNERVEPKFLYHQLAWGKTQSRIRETASTTTNISNVSTKKLLTLEMFTPPLETQREIVAELEIQFSRLDEAVANLQRVKANLKRYKASVLDAAATGGFGESSEVSFLEWERTTLGSIADVIDPNPSHRMPKYFPDGIPLISTENFIGEEEIDFHKGKKVGSETLSSQRRLFAVEEGDFVLSRIGTIGKTRFLPLGRDYCLSHALVVIKVNTTRVDKRWLRYVISSRSVLSQAREGVQSVGVPDLGMGKIRGFEIAIPPIEEQLRIAGEVDRRLSIVHEVEAEVDTNLQRAQALRNSVLAKSFEGCD